MKFCHARVLALDAAFTAVSIVVPSCCTTTVLVVPKIPPGLLTLPTQKDTL
ncbi:MAG TPA: hypothetical protein VE684_03300 [Crenalkalicoccus sp.]|nr:hypothetical protein [Crenalkalicoccus sp.]